MRATSPAVLSIVTGANRGIGLAASRDLARKGHRVIMTARDESKGQIACQSLKTEHPALAEKIYFHPLDVSNPHSVRQLKEFVEAKVAKEKPDGVVLLNNAGVLHKGWSEKEFKETMAANVETVKWSHVINVSSGWGSITYLPEGSYYRTVVEKFGYGKQVTAKSGGEILAQLQYKSSDMISNNYPPTYKISKCFLNLFTQMLAQREGQGNKIFASAVDPGWVRTDMGGAGATRSVEEGIDTMVWLATQVEDELQWKHNGALWCQRKLVSW